jgi:hypothetical protein
LSRTWDSTAATSDHGTRTRPSPPSLAAILPRRPAQDRHNLSLLTRPALDGQVVDVPATTSLGVEQLVVEDAEREVELFAHDCPTLVRIISGIAERETARMTTK